MVCPQQFAMRCLLLALLTSESLFTRGLQVWLLLNAGPGLMHEAPIAALSAVRLVMSLAAETAGLGGLSYGMGVGAGAAGALPQLVGGLPYRHMWSTWVHAVRPTKAAGTSRPLHQFRSALGGLHTITNDQLAFGRSHVCPSTGPSLEDMDPFIHSTIVCRSCARGRSTSGACWPAGRRAAAGRGRPSCWGA
jgi:hypothetical protein